MVNLGWAGHISYLTVKVRSCRVIEECTKVFLKKKHIIRPLLNHLLFFNFSNFFLQTAHPIILSEDNMCRLAVINNGQLQPHRHCCCNAQLFVRRIFMLRSKVPTAVLLFQHKCSKPNIFKQLSCKLYYRRQNINL